MSERAAAGDEEGGGLGEEDGGQGQEGRRLVAGRAAA